MESEKYLKKRIYLIGPHSTGKSTLALELSKYFGNGVPLLKETARAVLLAKGYRREDINSTKCFQMQKDILKAQFNAEETFGDDVNFISDRAGIDAILYTMKYCPIQDSWLELTLTEEWQTLLKTYQNPSKSLIILLTPCSKFLLDDGIRQMPASLKEWNEFGEMYEEFLENQNISYEVIGGNVLNLQDRVQQVLNWIQ